MTTDRHILIIPARFELADDAPADKPRWHAVVEPKPIAHLMLWALKAVPPEIRLKCKTAPEFAAAVLEAAGDLYSSQHGTELPFKSVGIAVHATAGVILVPDHLEEKRPTSSVIYGMLDVMANRGENDAS